MKVRRAAVPALVGMVVVAVAGVAMWTSDEPWTFTLDTGSVFLGQTLPAMRAWFAGRVPEWSDLLWGGFPLIGDCTTAALYPLYALTYLATLAAPLRFFDVAFAVHLGIFAAGAAALVQQLGGSARAAVLAGVLSALDPFAHYCAVTHFPVFGAHAWWPWAFVAVEALTRPTTPIVGGAMALGWVAIAMQTLVGVPEQMLYCAVPAAVWLLVRRTPLGFGHRVARAAVLAAGAAALAAPQLAATMLILPWTHRSGTPPGAQLGSLWLTKPITLFVAGTGVLNGLPHFIGIARPLLATIAVSARRQRAAFLLALAVVGFLLALGPQVGLYSWLHAIPPFDHFRNPGKIFALATYPLAWGAALGADALWRRGGRAARVTAALLVAAVLGEHAVYLPDQIGAMQAQRAGDGLSPERYARLAELTLLRREAPGKPPPPIYDMGGPFGGEYARNVGALLDIASLHAGSVALLGRGNIALLDRPSVPMLDLFGARYIVAPANKCATIEYQYKRWRTIERGAHDCVLAHPSPVDRHAVLAQVAPVASEHAMRRAVRERPVPTPVVGPPELATRASRGTVLLRSYESGRASLVVMAGKPALLLVRESFAPGWHVRVDGRPVTPIPAAGIYFAVPFDTGVHTVDLAYRAPGLRGGMGVAIAWTIGALAAAALARRRRAYAPAA
jgi:hypothetical protein